MAEILDPVLRFFREDNWSFVQLEEQSILRMGFQGKTGSWLCFAEARDEFAQFIFYSVCPVNTPEEKLPVMTEFLTRVNYGLVLGNFEMDVDDGEIRFKTSIDVQDVELSQELIRNVVFANIMMMDRYLPAIMAVLYGGVSPLDAIAQVEG